MLNESLKPGGEIGADEILGSRTPRQAHRRWAAFTLEAQIDVEEGAAEALLRDPFLEHRERLRIGWKFEFVAVGQLAHRELDGAKRGPEDFKMALADFRRQREPIAREGCVHQ